MTLEARAVVMRIEGGRTFVEPAQANSCGQCKGKGCGTSALSKVFCSQSRQFQVDNAIGAQIGDQVVVSVADGELLRGIGLVYLLPLALLGAGALCGSAMSGTEAERDGYAAIGAAIGLAGGFWMSRWLDSRRLSRLPHIERHWRDD